MENPPDVIHNKFSLDQIAKILIPRDRISYSGLKSESEKKPDPIRRIISVLDFKNAKGEDKRIYVGRAVAGGFVATTNENDVDPDEFNAVKTDALAAKEMQFNVGSAEMIIPVTMGLEDFDMSQKLWVGDGRNPNTLRLAISLPEEIIENQKTVQFEAGGKINMPALPLDLFLSAFAKGEVKFAEFANRSDMTRQQSDIMMIMDCPRAPQVKLAIIIAEENALGQGHHPWETVAQLFSSMAIGINKQHDAKFSLALAFNHVRPGYRKANKVLRALSDMAVVSSGYAEISEAQGLKRIGVSLRTARQIGSPRAVAQKYLNSGGHEPDFVVHSIIAKKEKKQISGGQEVDWPRYMRMVSKFPNLESVDKDSSSSDIVFDALGQINRTAMNGNFADKKKAIEILSQYQKSGKYREQLDYRAKMYVEGLQLKWMDDAISSRDIDALSEAVGDPKTQYRQKIVEYWLCKIIDLGSQFISLRQDEKYAQSQQLLRDYRMNGLLNTRYVNSESNGMGLASVLYIGHLNKHSSKIGEVVKFNEERLKITKQRHDDELKKMQVL